ncbi:MAG: hypothetical protein AABX16_02890 [Nanoarchaeota archaeon]
MGKNSAVRTLGNRIGNIVLHKMLITYTNKPESVNHLFNEENEYRAAALMDAKRFNWNEKDKQRLKILALEFIKNKSIKKYPDVLFPLKEAEMLVNKELKELNL